jgi:hypothetical protein
MPGHYAIPCECAPLDLLIQSMSTRLSAPPSPSHALLLLHLTSTLLSKSVRIVDLNNFFKNAINALNATGMTVTVAATKIRCDEPSHAEFPWTLSPDGRFYDFPSNPWPSARSVLLCLDLKGLWPKAQSIIVALPSYDSTPFPTLSLDTLLQTGCTW